MKRVFEMKSYFAAIVAIVCLSVVACSDDDLDMPVFWTDMGMVTYVGEGNYFEIRRDDNQGGALLCVVETMRPQRTLSVGERVYFNYSIHGNASKGMTPMPDRVKAYNIKLNDFLNVLSKPIITESFIREDEAVRRDSVGCDGIEIYRAWYYGDWLNIEFLYVRNEDSEVKHLVTLVWDDVREDAPGTAYLRLCHNAYGEVPGNEKPLVTDTGLASFRLSDIVPEGVTSIEVKLVCLSYNIVSGEPEDYVISMKELFYPIRYMGDREVIITSGDRYYIGPPANTATFVR